MKDDKNQVRAKHTTQNATLILCFVCFNIVEKLRELNAKQESMYKIPDEKLDAIGKLTGDRVSDEVKTSAISALKSLLDWPNDTVFPALDVARLAVLHKQINDQLCTEELLPVIRRHVKPDATPSNQMLTFRLIANMFQHEKGEKLCLDHSDEILKSLLDLQSLGNKNNQVTPSNFLLEINNEGRGKITLQQND